MTKATLLLMLIALVLWACANSPPVSQDMFLVEKGFEELSNSNYLEAEAYLMAALDINPNNPYTLLNLGVVFQDTGRTKEAIQMYQKVLEKNPDETAVKSNREGYSGKKVVEIAMENLKSLGVFIAQKGPVLNTKSLEESVVKESEVKPVIIPYEAPLQIISYSAAGHASVLDAEGNQESVDIASVGGPSGIGASSEGSGGEAASGVGNTGGSGSGSSSGGDSGSGSGEGSDGGDPGDGDSDGGSDGDSSGGNGGGNGNGNGNSGGNGNGNGNGNSGGNGGSNGNSGGNGGGNGNGNGGGNK